MIVEAVNKLRLYSNRAIGLVKKKSFSEWVEYLNSFGIEAVKENIIIKKNMWEAINEITKNPLYSDEELERQRKQTFSRPVRFSIIVPVYNTPQNYLTEMIESVLTQTYSDLELCLADASDNGHGYVGKICMDYANKDSRVKYKKLENNLGISENTNACIGMSTGEYISLLDHDDILHPSALFETYRAICDKNADFVYTDEAVFEKSIDNIISIHYKPAFAPDTLLSNNYICHFSTFSRALFEKADGFRKKYDGSQDHEFFLRATDLASKVVHIPEILYYWRSSPGSVAQSISEKPYAAVSGINAVHDFLESKGIRTEVESVKICPTIYRIKYELSIHPKVSILIPNCDQIDALKKCISSILKNTTYDNYEIVIIENNSKSSEIFEYYSYLEGTYNTYNNINVIKYEGRFNYSKINNFGVVHTDGDIILLLNNDIEVITPDWIQEMLMFATRDDVGAVGAKLYFPDSTIQHAGIVLGAGGIAGHSYYHMYGKYKGYAGRLYFIQNVTAVTGACLMVRRDIWNEVSGLNEDFATAYNDVDFCMRIRRLNKLVIWTPFAELIHHESLSRGNDFGDDNIDAFRTSVKLFKKLWESELEKGDIYYNPNFRISDANCMFNKTIEPHSAR